MVGVSIIYGHANVAVRQIRVFSSNYSIKLLKSVSHSISEGLKFKIFLGVMYLVEIKCCDILMSLIRNYVTDVK